MIWDKINDTNISFLLIDLQEAFYSIAPKKVVNNVIDNVSLINEFFKANEIPRVATIHYPKGLGPMDEGLVDEWNGAPIIEKISFSCCGEEDFLEVLRQQNREVVILAGLEAHICVLQTVLGLKALEKEVIVLSDAVYSSSKEKWQEGLRMAKEAGAHILNTESVLFYLAERADTPEFKVLHKIMKAQRENA